MQGMIIWNELERFLFQNVWRGRCKLHSFLLSLLGDAEAFGLYTWSSDLTITLTFASTVIPVFKAMVAQADYVLQVPSITVQIIAALNLSFPPLTFQFYRKLYLLTSINALLFTVCATQLLGVCGLFLSDFQDEARRNSF